MSEQTPNVSAGWYPTGAPGDERWWDGTAWTEHVHSVLPPGGPKPPGFQWGGNAVASLVAGIVIGIVALGFGALSLLVLVTAGFFAAFPPAFAALALLAFALIGILNWNGLTRQQAAGIAEAERLRLLRQPPQ